MTKVYLLGNAKGGPGKTTMTVNLASELAARGRKVLVVDADEQGHSHWFLNKREKAIAGGLFSGNSIEVITTTSDNAEFAQKLKQLKRDGDYDNILIDTSGKENETFKVCIPYTDTVIIPFVYAGFDVRELIITLRHIETLRIQIDNIAKEHGGKGFDINCVIVPNRAEHSSNAVQSEITEMLRESGAFKYANLSSTSIKKVARWGTNVMHGLSIVDAKLPARSGFQLLADELEGKRSYRINRGE